MKHFIIFLYFISFTTGFSLILLGFFLWLKNKQKMLLYFIITAFSLTLILFEQAISAYDTVNAIQNSRMDILLRYVSTLGCSLMIYSLTMMIVGVACIEITRRRNWFLRIYSVLPLLAVTVYYTTDLLIVLRISSILYFTSILFNMVILVSNLDQIENAILKSILRKFLVISLLMFPILFLDTFVEKLQGMGENFPLGLLSVMIYYIVFSGMSLSYIIGNYDLILTSPMKQQIATGNMSFVSENSTANNMDIVNDVLVSLNSFNITNREKEIIFLLIKGLSYNDISEKLMISLPTVKTHVHNIYKKLGIKNKIELVNIISKNKISE